MSGERSLQTRKKPRSTTPKADAWREEMDKWYARHEHIDCTSEQAGRAVCRVCGVFRMVLSDYALSRGPEELLVTCDCKRWVWLNRTDYNSQKEGPKIAL